MNAAGTIFIRRDLTMADGSLTVQNSSALEAGAALRDTSKFSLFGYLVTSPDHVLC